MEEKYNKREKLKTFRKGNNLSQQEMANLLELSLIQYQFIELGRRNPSYQVLMLFKNIFPKSNIEEIFFNLKLY